MQKLFAVTIIFALILAGCEFDEDADVKGLWYGNYDIDNKGEITLDIGGKPSGSTRLSGEGSYVLVFKSPGGTISRYNGNCYRIENTLTFNDDRERKASLIDGKLILDWKTGEDQLLHNTYELSRKKNDTGAPAVTADATLKIKNESSKTITNVRWNNVTFMEGSITSGTSVSKDVEAGSGYIFFKIGTKEYRTQERVIVEKKGSKEFGFYNNTFVVDLLSDATATLGGL